MSQASNEYRIVTRWRVEARIEEVCDILSAPERFPDWWGAVYQSIEVLERGDATGKGGRVAICSRGWLPYRLNWIATVSESNRPHDWRVRAEGDLEGEGKWQLVQEGPMAVADYDWLVKAEKPVLRLLSPVLAPLFAWNHRWAMARGQEGLQGELRRRRQAGLG